MSGPRSTFHEDAASPRTESLSLSHLSIEVGHFYTEDYQRDDDEVEAYFRRVAGWVEAVTRINGAELAPLKPRISTCFMIDDYFGQLDTPEVLVPRILRIASRAGLRIDYLARESGCVRQEEVELAALVESRLVAEPSPGVNGSRPPPTEIGWLSNGQRSPVGLNHAMASNVPWQPPKENADNAHSIFMDVELWSREGATRRWACAFLAAVWQLQRLGMLRNKGAVTVSPGAIPAELPQEWSQLPAVMALQPDAAPFSAYRAMTIMDSRFLKVEHGVRTILGSVSCETAVMEQLRQRVDGEKLRLPAELVDRLEYVFLTEPWR